LIEEKKESEICSFSLALGFFPPALRESEKEREKGRGTVILGIRNFQRSKGN
jgi:hypothetical protein